jgi:hypothetical protein
MKLDFPKEERKREKETVQERVSLSLYFSFCIQCSTYAEVRTNLWLI